MDDYMKYSRLIILIISILLDIICLSCFGFVLKLFYEIKIICLKKTNLRDIFSIYYFLISRSRIPEPFGNAEYGRG